MSKMGKISGDAQFVDTGADRVERLGLHASSRWNPRGQRPRFQGAAILAFAAFAALGVSAASAATVKVSLKDHRFAPAEITAPAGTPITIVVTNQDSTPSEFESKTLRVEKVVNGGGTITLQIRALTPGRYRFFDDYHEDTTEGFLVVQ
jgi:plastocyanin